MHKNKVVLVLSCIFSVLFLAYIFKLTSNIKNIEEDLLSSPNIINVTDKIETKLFVTSTELKDKNWTRPEFSSNWKKIPLPKYPINQESDYKEGSFAYYRIRIPSSGISQLNHLRSELYLALQYILFNKFDIFVNGEFYRTSTPANASELIINIPIDESRDNLVAIKGYIKEGDMGITHRSSILVGKGGELNELHRKAYKSGLVYPLIFILCKSSVLFVFTLIFLVVRVDSFFEKSLLFSMFVVCEDILTSEYADFFLSFTHQVYLFNFISLGVILFLVLFLADVLRITYLKKTIVSFACLIFLASVAISYDALNNSILFSIDHLLRFWSYSMILTLVYFTPKLFKIDKVLSLSLFLALCLAGWSAFFSVLSNFLCKFIFRS